MLFVLRKCFLLCILLGCTAALAIGVSPTKIVISPIAPIASLTLTNEGDTAITMQLEIVKWQQHDEEEIYTSSDDIIATPQIFNIPPKGIQLVRFGLEKPLYSNQEKAYRIFIREVISRATLKPGQLKMAIRLSLPLIIEPLTAIHEKVIWRSELLKNKLKIVAFNQGNNIVFINFLQGYVNKKPMADAIKTFTYILPGSKKTWFIKSTNNQKISSIKASVNSNVVFSNLA